MNQNWIVENLNSAFSTWNGKLSELWGLVNQHKYMILSTNKASVEEARDRLRQVQGHLIGALSALGCSVSALDNNARLTPLETAVRLHMNVKTVSYHKRNALEKIGKILEV